MSAQEPHPSEESLRQIEETLEQKPDRDVVEKWLSKVMLKLGEIHEDVRELERELRIMGGISCRTESWGWRGRPCRRIPDGVGARQSAGDYRGAIAMV